MTPVYLKASEPTSRRGAPGIRRPRTLWVSAWTARVIVARVAVGCPLPDIPEHIEKTEIIRVKRLHVVGARVAVAFEPGDMLRRTISQLSGTSARGVLPFGLGRESASVQLQNDTAAFHETLEIGVDSSAQFRFSSGAFGIVASVISVKCLNAPTVTSV